MPFGKIDAVLDFFFSSITSHGDKTAHDCRGLEEVEPVFLEPMEKPHLAILARHTAKMPGLDRIWDISLRENDRSAGNFDDPFVRPAACISWQLGAKFVRPIAADD